MIYIFKVNKYKIEENITEITGKTKKRSLFRKKQRFKL